MIPRWWRVQKHRVNSSVAGIAGTVYEGHPHSLSKGWEMYQSPFLINLTIVSCITSPEDERIVRSLGSVRSCRVVGRVRTIMAGSFTEQIIVSKPHGSVVFNDWFCESLACLRSRS